MLTASLSDDCLKELSFLSVALLRKKGIGKKKKERKRDIKKKTFPILPDMVSVHFCKLRLLKTSVNIYASSSSPPFTGPQQLLHGLGSPQLPPRPKSTFFFFLPTKDLRRRIRDFIWATVASLL